MWHSFLGEQGKRKKDHLIHLTIVEHICVLIINNSNPISYGAVLETTSGIIMVQKVNKGQILAMEQHNALS